MGSNLFKFVVIVLVVVGITMLVQLIGGVEAAGLALASMAVMLGAYYGVGWGGRQATKTEEYRQELRGKRASPTTYYYDDGSSSDDPVEGSQASQDGDR